MENTSQQVPTNDNLNANSNNVNNANRSSLSKVGYVLSLISSIIGIIVGVILIIASFVYFANSSVWANHYEHFEAVKTVILTYAAVLLIIGCLLLAFLITNLVFINKDLKNLQNPKHKIFVAVVSIIFGCILGIIGGIFILVDDNKKNN